LAEQRQGAALQKVVMVVIVCSSIYTGGVARLVTFLRSANFGNGVFELETRKKIFNFGIFWILRAARFVTSG
jgi:hypothetical protein